jgi:hypothetical protein
LLLPAALPAQEAKKKEPDPRPDEVSPTQRKTPLTEAPHGVKLPAGYEHRGEIDFEGTAAGDIWKPGGLKIGYVIGPMFGQIVKPQDKACQKYWEQVVNGRTVRFCSRDKYLLISLPLGGAADTLGGANFGAAVEKIEDAADMVTIALSMIREDKPGEKPTR